MVLETQGSKKYCIDIGLPILMRIPYDRAIAEGTARGQTLFDIDPKYIMLFQQLLLRSAESWLNNETICNLKH